MMNERLKLAFEGEMRVGYERSTQGDRVGGFRHFERAHVLGQRHTVAHVRSHWAMLGIGWANRDAREVLGQIARMPAALLFSRVWVPVGNTGGANVSAFKPMPIPSDLAALMDETSAS
jgi:hypothetical protein